MGVGDVSKRILLGRKLRSSQLGETLLPKRIALPVFASDALSSVAYARDEVFIMLSLAGASYYIWSWKIAIAVAIVTCQLCVATKVPPARPSMSRISSGA